MELNIFMKTKTKMKRIFSNLILIGRPASGKSEIIDFIHKTSNFNRDQQLHLGKRIHILDDFPMLWAWFEEDYFIEHVFGKERLHSTSEGYFKEKYMWNLLLRRVSLEHTKIVKDSADEFADQSIIIEFARGTEHGDYKEAFEHLSDEILSDAVVLYVKVPYEESLRKNRKRRNPDKPHSILEHSLDDKVLETLYKECDWEEFSSGDKEYLYVRQHKIPYVVFDNMPSKTDSADDLAPELNRLLNDLWAIYNR